MCIVEGDLNFLAPAGRHVYSNSQLKLYRLGRECQRKTVGSRASDKSVNIASMDTCIGLLDHLCISTGYTLDFTQNRWQNR